MSDDRDARAMGPPSGSDPRPSPAGAPSAAQLCDDPLLGAWIERRFTIIERIGQGGMGRVYKAVQAPMGRICALKVLSPACDDQERGSFHKRFFLEAAMAAKLVHPNSVNIYDYGSSGSIYYIAMEFLEGDSLRKILRADGRIHPVRVRHIAMQVCRSLREAHSIGFIHRDLKPENIIVLRGDTRKSHVKVVDFGLAKAFRGDLAEDITGNGMAIGSPSYMSPEQILGEPISPATDVYALGTLMFEMLTGDVPFSGMSRYHTLMAHVHDAPPTLASRLGVRKLHPGWEAIVSRCLQKRPADRFAGMDDLLAALKELPGPRLPSRPSIAPQQPQRPAPASPPAASPRSTARLLAVPFAVVVVVAATTAALWTARQRLAPAPTTSAREALEPPPTIRQPASSAASSAPSAVQDAPAPAMSSARKRAPRPTGWRFDTLPY